MRPKVVVWADQSGPYGVGRFTSMLTAGLGRAGWTVVDSSAHGVDLWGRDAMRAFDDRATPEAVFRGAQPDAVLYVNASPLSNVAAIQTARQMGVPTVVVVQGGGASPLPDAEGLAARATAQLSAVAAVVTPSRALLASMQGRLVPKGAGTVIPNAAPDAFFARPTDAERAATRVALGIPVDSIVFLSAARMEHDKGWDLLVDSIAEVVPPERDRMQFVWAGHGTQRARLSAVVRLLQLDGRVRVLGLVENMAPLVHASDVFVLPTRQDVAPFALIEAMAAGLAVITTAVGEIASMVQDAGIVLSNPASVPRQSSVAALVDALGRVEDDASRRELGKRARTRADREYRASLMVERYDALLRTLL